MEGRALTCVYERASGRRVGDRHEANEAATFSPPHKEVDLKVSASA